MESGFGDFLRQIPVPLIGMFCVSALLLVVVGGYIMWARSQRRQTALANAINAGGINPSTIEPADMPDLDSLTSPGSIPAVAPRPTGTQRIKLAEGEMIDVVEVLTVLRDVADGSLIVQIGESAFRNPPATADAEFKRRFNLTMKELVSGARSTATVPAVIAADAPADSAEAVPPKPTPAATGEMPVVPPGVPLPGDLPKFKMPDTPEIPSRRGRKPPKADIPEINIAAAIESYLQHKLALTPEYAGRSIHVRSAAHGGVQIDVDGRMYEAVGDIEDAAVRQFLASTIEEWQSRQ